MLIGMMIVSSAALATPQPTVSACRPAQLRLSLDSRDGEYNGMSHSGSELTLRNVGSDCSLPALPTIQLRDARGGQLLATRQAPVGMHPGPAMVPVRIAAGHRASADLRWVAGPVFAHSRSVRIASITVRIGTATLRAPLSGVIFGEAGKTLTFEQTPLRAMEGMASD